MSWDSSVHEHEAFQPQGPTWRGLGGINVETLAANKTMVWTDAQTQRLDPGGATRTVTLPAEGTAKKRSGAWFGFINSADADGEDLTVKNDGGSTIGTCPRGHYLEVEMDAAATWRVVKNTAVGETVQTVTGTISAAQLLALNATPQTLVAAPGAGLFLELVSAHFWLDFESKAHTAPAAGEDLAIKYTDGSGEEVARLETTGFLDGTADEHRTVQAGAAYDAVADHTPVANAALVAHLLVGELGGSGDSPLKFEVAYRVRDYTW